MAPKEEQMKTLQAVFSSASIQQPVADVFLDVTFPNGTQVTYTDANGVVTDGYGKYQADVDETLHGYGLLSWKWGSLTSGAYASPQGGSLVVDAPLVSVSITFTPAVGAVVEDLVITFTGGQGQYLGGYTLPTAGPLVVNLPEADITWEVAGRSTGTGTFTNNGTAQDLAITEATAALTADTALVHGLVEGIPEGDEARVEILVWQVGTPAGNVLGFPDKERSAQFPVGSKFRIVTHAYGPTGEWSAKVPSGTIISVNRGTVTRTPPGIQSGRVVLQLGTPSCSKLSRPSWPLVRPL